jgi:hypothetical protein
LRSGFLSGEPLNNKKRTKLTPLNRFSLILSFVLVIASAVLCQQIISNSIAGQIDKNDHAELNHVKYGLFSIDEWKRQIGPILTGEINKLSLSTTNEEALRKHLEVLLNTVIDQIDKKIREGNSGTAGGQVKQAFINVFINLDDIKKGIPEYADSILHEMTKPETKRQIKTILSDQLQEYSSLTFDTRETAQMRRILLRMDAKDIEGAKIKLSREISAKGSLISIEVILLIILSAILFAMSGFSKQPLLPARYFLLVLSLVLLLTAGVTTPTIDMEAKISQMRFMVMGHPIHFENQVLYFQSKSILDVFWIMITDPAVQMKLVGLLLITFSILFPLAKLILSLVHYYNYRGARENRVIQFFVLKSGKWSMADVMVVAIFMAYLGFNGIITSQLGQLSAEGQELVVLTTNGTSLQPGYYLFLTYTLLALFFSGFLTREPRTSKT